MEVRKTIREARTSSRSEPAGHSTEHPRSVFGLFGVDFKPFAFIEGGLNIGHGDRRRDRRGNLAHPEVLGHGRAQGATGNHRLEPGLSEHAQDMVKPLSRL